MHCSTELSEQICNNFTIKKLHEELVFGLNSLGQKTLGFKLGPYNESLVIVSPVAVSSILSHVATKIAQIFQTYLDSSVHPCFDRDRNTGFYKSLQIRAYSTGDCLVVLRINSGYMSKSGLRVEIEKFLATFESVEYLRHLNASVFIKEIDSPRNTTIEPIVTLRRGEGYCLETVCGLSFKVGLRTFFPMCSEAANIYYGVLKDWFIEYATKVTVNMAETENKETLEIGMDKKILLLDLYCGIGRLYQLLSLYVGIIGQLLATHVDKVLGIDTNSESITCSKQNMIQNGIFNASYVCSKIENALPGLIEIIVTDYDEIVAIIEAPRTS